MKQASPRLMPYIIYQLVLEPGLGTIVKGIDYGPVKAFTWRIAATGREYLLSAMIKMKNNLITIIAC